MKVKTAPRCPAFPALVSWIRIDNPFKAQGLPSDMLSPGRLRTRPAVRRKGRGLSAPAHAPPPIK